ncbi:MAG: type I DNA topoisomerase [Chloroflexi bacterium]|nr:type I DNA topoisomerase [Chloroflexota bacterium]
MAERKARGTTANPSPAAGGTLVVVESPKKARTLQGILGRGFRVEASFGHVRDLPTDRLGVDAAHDFAPEYVPVPKAAARLSGLRKAAKESAQVILATDPDREGEAIAWHLATALDLREGRYSRVSFHEITASAVKRAFQEPRALDMPLVNAQQARRVLDRLVGYRLSPLLWRKVQKGASAGRVQSVALRLIVEREREIRAFVPKEYWTIDARLAAAGTRGDAEAFTARLTTIDGAKAEITEGDTARQTVANLEKAQYTIDGAGQKGREQGPPPPFTTSTLQQTAANRLHLAGKRTMQIAQSLFEGSYITYHRTDSVQVSSEAVSAARKVIAEQFPPEYLPDQPRHYRTRSKNAQEAHEAIRPVDPARTPDALRNELSAEEARRNTPATAMACAPSPPSWCSLATSRCMASRQDRQPATRRPPAAAPRPPPPRPAMRPRALARWTMRAATTPTNCPTTNDCPSWTKTRRYGCCVCCPPSTSPSRRRVTAKVR